MDSIGTILGLLLLLVPLFAKLIEKVLQNAGRADAARKVREMADVFSEMKQEYREDEASGQLPPDPLPQYQSSVSSDIPLSENIYALPQTSELLEGGYRSIKDIVSERAVKSGGQDSAGPDHQSSGKLDKKKLIIYSEIMKRMDY